MHTHTQREREIIGCNLYNIGVLLLLWIWGKGEGEEEEDGLIWCPILTELTNISIFIRTLISYV